MELHIQNIIRICDIQEPNLVLDIPPSDNKRKTKGHGGRIFTARAVKQFKEYALMEVRSKDIWLPDPPVIVLYRAHFDSRRRDAANISKVMVDALFKQDRKAVPWPLPPRHEDVDKKSPHVDIWFVKVKE